MINLQGKRFGMLLVLSREGSTRNGQGTAPTWRALCDCGGEIVATGPNLKKGSTLSCGCLRQKHGMFGTPEYSAWIRMIQRCTNPAVPNYPSYGGRGITVCVQWRENFTAFLADMGRRPAPGYSLDRIDNNGNYEPSNCRWATAKQQARNKRTSHVLTVNGESLTLAAWTERLGAGQHTIRERLNRGWTAEAAATTPVSREP